MTKNSKVSILVPLYNAEEYVVETIESCLNQTYNNIEIIIVDDGSTDSSLIIVKEYEKQYKNIKVVTQKNSGASTARNKAFYLATGEYVQYLDADDILDKDKIRLQMEVLKQEDTDTIAFGTWATFHKSIENVVWKYPPVNKNYNDGKEFLIDLWSSGMAVVVYSWLVPRKLVEESGGWNESISTNDDGEFFARIVIRANKILFVKDSFGYYRKDNSNSLSKQVSRKALMSTLESFETYMDIMKDELEENDVGKSLAYLYSRYLYYLYPEYKDLVLYVENKLKYLGYEKPLLSPDNKYYFLSKIIGVYGVICIRKLIRK